MSDISKQLCERAGIPKQCSSDLGFDVEDACRTKKEDGCEGCEFLVYPSFENPANLIKLLEIMFLFPFNFKSYDTYKESVLNGAIEEAKAGNAEFIKALQSGEWSYWDEWNNNL